MTGLLDLVQGSSAVWLSWMLCTGIEGAVLGVFVWIVLRFARWMPPRFLYGVLLIALVKCMIPAFRFSLSAPDSPHRNWIEGAEVANTLREAGQAALSTRLATIAQTSGMTERPVKLAKASRISIRDVLFVIYLLGVVTFTIVFVMQVRSWRAVSRSAKPVKSAFLLKLGQECARICNLESTPRLFMSDACFSPVVLGVVKPVVILPKSLRATRKGLRALILHEFTHMKHRDPLSNLLRTAVQIIWWWNPLVHWLNTKAGAYQEMCCDEVVLGRAGLGERAYLRLIVDTAEVQYLGSRFFAAVGLSEAYKSTQERMIRILTRKGGLRARLSWLWRLSLLVFLAAVFTGLRGVEARTGTVFLEFDVTTIHHDLPGLIAAARSSFRRPEAGENIPGNQIGTPGESGEQVDREGSESETHSTFIVEIADDGSILRYRADFDEPILLRAQGTRTVLADSSVVYENYVTIIQQGNRRYIANFSTVDDGSRHEEPTSVVDSTYVERAATCESWLHTYMAYQQLILSAGSPLSTSDDGKEYQIGVTKVYVSKDGRRLEIAYTPDSNTPENWSQAQILLGNVLDNNLFPVFHEEITEYAETLSTIELKRVLTKWEGEQLLSLPTTVKEDRPAKG